MSSYYRQQLEEFLRGLSIKAGTVLDIGGAQKPVNHRTATWEVLQYEVLDLPEYDLNTEWSETPKGDIIFCLEVFEYLINPLQAMKNIANCLGERAYITFPLIYPVHNEIEFDSLRYTETGIKRLAGAAGLKVDKVHYRRTKKTRPEWQSNLLQYYMIDGMKAARGVDHEITGYIVELVK
jgi:hypothetical protein